MSPLPIPLAKADDPRVKKLPGKDPRHGVHAQALDSALSGVAPRGAYGAAAVLHDVRNLLVTVASLTSQVRAAMDAPGGNGGVRDVVEDLRRAVEEAMVLAKGLPKHTREGGMEVLPFLTEHLSALAAHFNGRGSIHLSIDPRCAGSRIALDPTDLLRVLTNVFRNAAEACQSQGSVEVALGLSELHVPVPVLGGALLMDGSYVQLTISDEGTGLAPELLDGYRSPRAPLPGTPGAPSGLGLWTVIELLGRAGGGMILQNRPPAEGPGARAELLIPRLEVHRG